MPGEERKFSRTRIVAFVPVCSRDRDVVASQAVVVDGVSTEVGVDSITGVTIGVGSGVVVSAAGFVAVGEGGGVCEAGGSPEWVAVGEGNGVSVGAPGLVAVGEGSEVGLGAPIFVALGEKGESVCADPVGAWSGVDVDSSAGSTTGVGEERGVTVAPTPLVAVESSIGSRVAVSDNDAEVPVILVEFGRGVAVKLAEVNSVGEGDMDTGAKAWGVVLLSNRRKRINKMIATINLKRS